MRPALTIILLSVATLCGCDAAGITGGGATSDTNMRSVDIQAGTASDEMILLDSASGDGTAVDTSAAVGPAPPRPAGDAGEGASTDERANDSGDDGPAPAAGGDAVIRPPTGGAEPDGPPEPAKK